MRRSFLLRSGTTVHQTQAVLARLEGAMSALGATTQRTVPAEVLFEMPPPWRFAPIGWLAIISRGTATLSAWGGGPWRVSYRLKFRALRVLTALVTLILVVLGWGWPRLSLLTTVLALWIVGYGGLYVLASSRFRRMLTEIASDVAERRSRPRSPEQQETVATQQPE
ncbi:MAG: hypothetical protein ACT4PJ_02725 [Gemmatimonadaceae bacterium]